MSATTRVKNEIAKADTKNELAAPIDTATLEQVLVHGDLSRLNPAQRLSYYSMRCEAAGLDPRAQPFQFITLQGKLVLYATKACTQQLAGKHGVTTQVVDQRTEQELRVCVVRASAKDGRTTDEIGVVPIAGLRGEQLANAYMKAVTKAKRRATLALCGLGEMDETEVETVRGAEPVNVDLVTGEVVGATSRSGSNGVRKAPPPAEAVADVVHDEPEPERERESQAVRSGSEEHEYLSGSFRWGKKDLEDGTPMRGATRQQMIDSAIGRSFLGWARDKAEAGEMKDEAGRLLDIWHARQEGEPEEPARLPATKGKGTIRRTEEPVASPFSFDKADCERVAALKINKKGSKYEGKTLAEIVKEDRTYVESLYVQERYAVAAWILGFDLAEAKKHEDPDARRAFVEEVNRRRDSGAAKAQAMAGKSLKRLGRPSKDEGYELFLAELKQLCEEGGFDVGEVEAAAGEAPPDGYGKALKDLTEAERNELLANMRA